ncbi:MAG: hypothetical protein Q9171_001031 [Xanthocarpia ochracea]
MELLCVKLPDGLGFEEGSTMFFPYLTAMQSLITIGGLEKGQSVLIHSACGGVGLAAVQLAQVVEAEIYATVGSEEKVQHLMTTFNIPRERIFNSRDASFVKGLMQATHKKGVDLVLNSLSGELLHATWQYVASFGRWRHWLSDPNSAAFLATEIGKRLFDLLMRLEEDLNTSLSLSDLGMDSLVGIELRTWWKQVFGFKISVLELLGMGNLEALAQHAAEGLEKECRAQEGDTGC